MNAEAIKHFLLETWYGGWIAGFGVGMWFAEKFGAGHKEEKKGKL